MPEYFTSDSEHSISEDALRKQDRETQLEVMEIWFREHFEDPAQRTPYDSGEGGYIWVWGGPCDALEELQTEFGGVVPDDVIEELADELNGECPEWAPKPTHEDYDDYLVKDIAQITQFYENFSNGILDIQKLLETEIDESVRSCFLRLLYVNVITVLETYLSNAFINTVVNNQTLMRRFIETTPEFQAQKVPLSGVFKAVQEVERKAHEYLMDTVWHHLDRIKPMYGATLGIDFPSEVGEIFRAIMTRHDIVHRNGKTKGGEEILIRPEDVTNLIVAVEEFVQHIDAQIAKVVSGK